MRKKGKCEGLNPQIFFPLSKGGRLSEGAPRRDKNTLEREVADKYCTGCLAKVECLEMAFFYEHMTGHVQEGVWGGTTQKERRSMSKSILRAS